MWGAGQWRNASPPPPRTHPTGLIVGGNTPLDLLSIIQLSSVEARGMGWQDKAPGLSITEWWRMLSRSPPSPTRGEKPLDFALGWEGAKFKGNLVFILEVVGNFREALTLLLFI